MKRIVITFLSVAMIIMTLNGCTMEAGRKPSLKIDNEYGIFVLFPHDGEHELIEVDSDGMVLQIIATGTFSAYTENNYLLIFKEKDKDTLFVYDMKNSTSRTIKQSEFSSYYNTNEDIEWVSLW